MNTETKTIGKISNVEIRPSRRGQASGCVITFITDENVIKNDKLKLVFNDSTHYFSIHQISITEDKKLSVEASEVGYWARKFDRDKNFAIRSLLDVEVDLVRDEETLKNIHTMSCWC